MRTIYLTKSEFTNRLETDLNIIKTLKTGYVCKSGVFEIKVIII